MMMAIDIMERTGSNIRNQIFGKLFFMSGVPETSKLSVIYGLIEPSNKRVMVFYDENMIGFADIWIDEFCDLHVEYKKIKYD
jgi:hypothetical protein